MTATPLKRSVTQFDYRLGVPMLLYAATTYAALAQVAMPWFRSAGMYAAQLRRTADAIDCFVLRMQDESLAHTQYAPETVLDQRVWPILDISDPESGEPKKVWDPYPTYAVGAFDLGIPATAMRLGAAALRDFAMVAARFAAGASLFRQVDAVRLDDFGANGNAVARAGS